MLRWIAIACLVIPINLFSQVIDGPLYRVCVGQEPDDLFERCGYVNNKGDTIVPIGYYFQCLSDTITHFGVVQIRTTDGLQCCAINNSGEELFGVYWFDNGPDYIENGRFRILDDEGNIGYADSLGNVIVRPQYDCADLFREGYANVTFSCELIPDGEYRQMHSDEWLSIDIDGDYHFEEPTSLDSLEQKTLWATEYYVHKTVNGGTIPYLNDTGDTLGYFSDTCDFCTACLEGTVFLEGNKRVVLNYSSRADEAIVNCRECPKFANSSLNVESWGKVRWKVSSGFGEGVNGYRLFPYRTIAVDPTVIPYGTVLYIPAAVGTIVPRSDETIIRHDGYFFAGDTGGAIKQNHIDVFTGDDNTHPFDFVHSNNRRTFNAYIVKDPLIIKALTQLHHP